MKEKVTERLVLHLNSREIKQLAIGYINSAPLKKILYLAELQLKSKMGLIKEKETKVKVNEASGETSEIVKEETEGEQEKVKEAGKRHRWTKEEEDKLMDRFTPIKKDMQFKKEAKEKNKVLAEEMGLAMPKLIAKYFELMKVK